MVLLKQNAGGLCSLLAVALLVISSPLLATPQGISYQGRLADTNGDPLDGTYNLNFSIFTEATGGSLLWSEDILGVMVTDGLFKVTLGETVPFFTTIFHVDGLYLAIRVNGGAELTPRQKLASVPAAKVVETIHGSSGGDVSGNLGIEHSLIVGSGNTAHDTASACIGWDNNATGFLSSVVGGSSNSAEGTYSHIGGGINNSVSGNSSTVGGGDRNTAVGFATVAGGQLNEASLGWASIVGGGSNTASGLFSFVGGGQNNEASGEATTVAGGVSNSATQVYSAVVGGYDNNCTSEYSFIGGGNTNSCSSDFGSVLTGQENTVIGNHNVIVGGYHCSIAPGQIINSSYSMAFGDDVDLRGAVRVVGLFDGTSHGRLALNRDSFDGAISHPIHVGTNSNNGNGARLTSGGVWTNASSKEFKENFTPLDQQQLFDAIESLNIEGWNYRNSDEFHIGPYAEEFVEAFNVGTTDEETGERVNSHLAASDVAGVALAAVKELITENTRLRADLKQHQNKTESLKKRVEKLEQVLEMLAQN